MYHHFSESLADQVHVEVVVDVGFDVDEVLVVIVNWSVIVIQNSGSTVLAVASFQSLKY